MTVPIKEKVIMETTNSADRGFGRGLAVGVFAAAVGLIGWILGARGGWNG